MPPPKPLRVRVDPEDLPAPRAPRAARVLGPSRSLGRAGVVDVDPEALRKALGELTDQLGTVLRDIRAVGDFRLTEIQVAVEITAEGGLELIGSLKAGAKGAIQLKFAPPTTTG